MQAEPRKIDIKTAAPADWRAIPLKIGNWKGLIEECAISSMSDPFAMLSPRPRVSADATPSEEKDLRELLALMMRAIESDDEEPAVADDKKHHKKHPRYPHHHMVANDAAPTPAESVTGWIARLATQFDVTRGPRAAFFQGLRSYSSRFADKRFEDLSKGDRNVINLFVNRIQEAA